MHELGITRSVVAICTEQAQGRAVTRVRLEIGKLSAVLPDAVRFCFDVCIEDTPLAGAALEIDEIEGRGRCLDCNRELTLEHLFGLCECGSRSIECIAGRELNIKELEVVN
jgi:hydrogenase nickel incorporation protein HypA/HybF